MSRQTRICTISMDSRISGQQSMLEAFQEIEDKLKLGALDHPDLFLLPEACLTGLSSARLCNEKYYLTPETPIYQQFGRLADKYSAYIAVSALTLRDGRRYNSVLCFDRQGEVVFTYDKTYLTPDEHKAGLTPGKTNPNCFEADFGKIGFAICFDLNYRKLFEHYSEQGMEILLFPSYFPGGRILRNLAFDFSCFAVSSHAQGNESVFIDNFGREFARANMFTPALTQSLELDSTVLHLSGNLKKIAAIKQKYGMGIEFETHRPEGLMIIRSVTEKITVTKLINEFKLQSLKDFLATAQNCDNPKKLIRKAKIFIRYLLLSCCMFFYHHPTGESHFCFSNRYGVDFEHTSTALAATRSRDYSFALLPCICTLKINCVI